MPMNLRSYTVTVFHNGTGNENLLIQFAGVAANSFVMAAAIGERNAIALPTTGIISKINVEIEKK